MKEDKLSRKLLDGKEKQAEKRKRGNKRKRKESLERN